MQSACRSAGTRPSSALDGSYGLLFDGRWNPVGHAVTCCATSPSLCILEKLAPVEAPDLLPELVMVRYRVPDTLGMKIIDVARLPPGWQCQESLMQASGDGLALAPAGGALGHHSA